MRGGTVVYSMCAQGWRNSCEVRKVTRGREDAKSAWIFCYIARGTTSSEAHSGVQGIRWLPNNII